MFNVQVVTFVLLLSSSQFQKDFFLPGVLAMEALHRQVLPFLLRRMKEDVLQDLPPKIIQDYYCTLSPLQVPGPAEQLVEETLMFSSSL